MFVFFLFWLFYFYFVQLSNQHAVEGTSSIFLQFCMVEHLKWVCVSHPPRHWFRLDWGKAHTGSIHVLIFIYTSFGEVGGVFCFFKIQPKMCCSLAKLAHLLASNLIRMWEGNLINKLGDLYSVGGESASTDLNIISFFLSFFFKGKEKRKQPTILIIIIICCFSLFWQRNTPSICRNRLRKRYIKTNHND